MPSNACLTVSFVLATTPDYHNRPRCGDIASTALEIPMQIEFILSVYREHGDTKRAHPANPLD